MSKNKWENYFVLLFLFLIDIGFIWLLTFLIKPSITSDNIWFIALIYATIMGQFYKIGWKIK